MKATPGGPNLGLVCITHSKAVRYHTYQLSRYRLLPDELKGYVLEELYQANLRTLLRALEFCAKWGIRLYRLPPDLFPLSDLCDGVGEMVLEGLKPELARVGQTAERLGIRLAAHPEPFVVLSSESPLVVERSIAELEHQAQLLDWLGLPRSSWAAITIHGGKGGRGKALAEVVRQLPTPVYNRLCLENDERFYGAAEVVETCQQAGVPMVFDAHHHVVKERLDGFDHPSVAEFVRLARDTWPRAEWQIARISNGRDALHDGAHHDLVTVVPGCYRQVPWIEVEAKAKEMAIAHLQAHWLKDGAGSSPAESTPAPMPASA